MKPSAKYMLIPSLELGYAPFDEQHRQLVDKLNEMRNLPPDDATCQLALLRQFVDAFIDHMTFEINTLHELGYESTAAHENHHRQLEKEALAFLERCERHSNDEDAIQKFAWYFLEDAIKEDLKTKYFLEGKPVVSP